MERTQDDQDTHHARGQDFRRLGDAERALLSEHAPAPAGGGRALAVSCDPGGLAAHLAGLGYAVDTVDRADAAVARAGADDPVGVRRLCLDIERDDLHPLHDGGYDLITLRLVYELLHDRTRVLHDLSRRLRKDGALVVITPLAAATPEDNRSTALNETEISVLTAGWERAERFEADKLVVLILRGPGRAAAAPVEKRRPAPHAVTGAYAVVTDASGRILLGYSQRGMWELAGGKNQGPESFEETAVRELAEETGLRADPANAHLLAVLVDDSHGVPRLTAVDGGADSR